MVSSSYMECEDRVLAHEGSKYTDGVHPYDPGGPTRWGITIADARMYWKKDATADDVREMPRSVAVDIYRKHYWITVNGDALPAGIDDCVFDYGVNSGVGRSGRVLRRVLGLPDNDWHVTPEVLAAIDRRLHGRIIDALCDERLRFLQSLAIWPTYRTGWTIRVREVRDFAHLLDQRAQGTPVIKREPTPIPSAGMAKGTVAPPTTTKQVNAGATVTVGAALAGAAHWMEVHPGATIAVLAGAAACGLIIHTEISRRHHQLATAPMPGTEVVPEREAA